MVYAIAIFPRELREIELIRKKYDPRYKNIPAHITLVFPFPESFTKRQLIAYTKKVCSKFNKITVTTKTTEISWDFALLLLIDKGKNQLIKLHDELYSGILSEHLNKNYDYKTHITLGVFDNEKDAKKMHKKYPVVEKVIEINSVRIVQLNTQEGFIKTGEPKIIWSKEISLGSGS